MLAWSGHSEKVPKGKIVNKKWMIYGATGYTGKLIVEEAIKRGLTPILAGRNATKLQALATNSSLEYRQFDLSKRVHISEQLNDIDIVLHCAGPFSATARPMMAACLDSKTHYLDITGEIDIFQHAKQLDKSALKSGVILCPGVGFDVIPTDCLAATLKSALPNATSLWLGFSTRSGLSPGTAKTSVEGLAAGGKIRCKGKIKQVPLAYKERQIDFGEGLQNTVSIPWGDIATAYYSTGIPNIEVYIPMPKNKVKKFRRLNKVRSILAWKWVQGLLKKQIEKKVRGPQLEKRERSPSLIWGEVINQQGEIKTARLTTANGYTLTAMGSLGIVEYLLTTDEVVAGYKTASILMGADYVCTLPGSSEIIVS